MYRNLINPTRYSVQIHLVDAGFCEVVEQRDDKTRWQ
jgi:hypothetical protein